MRIVCTSDTHTLHHALSIPEGDVLIHAGDHCNHGTQGEVKKFDTWLAALPHAHKLVIAGNHDWPWQKHNRYARMWLKHGEYLQDSSLTVGGLKFWGSPWQPEFCDWAFNLPRGHYLARVWSQIPEDVQVLITHTPPQGILDSDELLGCADLKERLSLLTDLKLHVFGHIHPGYGQCQLGETVFVNACACDAQYRPVNPPIVIDL